MKLFVLFAVAALIVGSIYHREVSRFVADITAGSSQSGGGTSVAHSIQGMGKSSNDLMSGIGGALNR
jgi:hypothetical protein